MEAPLFITGVLLDLYLILRNILVQNNFRFKLKALNLLDPHWPTLAQGGSSPLPLLRSRTVKSLILQLDRVLSCVFSLGEKNMERSLKELSKSSYYKHDKLLRHFENAFSSIIFLETF